MARAAATRTGAARANTTALALAQGLPAVVIVGRTNAGKSTLFNRMVGGAHAITSPIPGTTRDLNVGRARHDGREFTVIDSGGLELGGREPLTERVVQEALRAIGMADVVVLLFDGRAGLSAADSEALELIRRTGTPLIMTVNKVDRSAHETAASEFYRLGAEKLFFISAEHGRGIDELLDEIASRIPARDAAARPKPDLKVAIMGRPNVGKSSLLNRLCGFERAIVSEVPGTTRDTLDVSVKLDDLSVLLIDTAGIRRPARVESGLERYSVGSAIATIRRADVVVLVVDATEGITDQDARLARLVDTNGRALVIVCNKWDAAAKLGRRIPAFVRDANERFPFLSYAAMVFTSALTGDGVAEVLPAARKAGESWRAQFQTAMLNRILADATAAMDPPLIHGKRLNVMYVTQVAASPPRLALFANLDRDIPAHYPRFLETRFRRALNLIGTPLRLEFRRTGGDRERTFRPRPRDGRPARSGGSR
jgi:GTP-binding protein